MTETCDIYERAFAKSDKTDAILVVDRKKLHVNKALLSYHSDFFNTLFNSDFKEKSMEEIPIDDVIYEDFATLLSVVHEKPIKFTESNAEKLLELADRFLVPAVKRHVELFLMTSSKDRKEKVRIANQYKLNALLRHTMNFFTAIDSFQESDHSYRNSSNKLAFINLRPNDDFATYSDETNEKLFERALEIVFENTSSLKSYGIPNTSDYENAFAKTDKTDAILSIDGEKLHVNKALLSYHSDYFNTLFNSNLEKTKEVSIDKVDFENFAGLLSLVQYNPIIPTVLNAEDLLELSNRFLMPSIKRHVELFLLSTSIDRMEKIRIGDKYQLEDLVTEGSSMFTTKNDFEDFQESEEFYEFSAMTKTKLFQNFLKIQFE